MLAVCCRKLAGRCLSRWPASVDQGLLSYIFTPAGSLTGLSIFHPLSCIRPFECGDTHLSRWAARG